MAATASASCWPRSTRAATWAASISTAASTTRALAPWAREIVELLNSYTEVSPSGHGLKVFFTHDPRDTLAEGVRWRSAVRQPAPNGGKEPGIEFYLRARYFTVTDATFEQYDTIRAVDLDTLRARAAADGGLRRQAQGADPSPAPPRRRPAAHHRRHRPRWPTPICTGRNGTPEAWRSTPRRTAAPRATRPSSAGRRRAASTIPDACAERWQHWHTSPPDRLTAGTIFHHAKADGWRDPRQAKSNGAASRTPPMSRRAKAIAWAAPEPLISDTEPPPPYPIEALPDLVRHAVEEVQLFVQAPDEMVAASAMSALSIAAQHLIDVRRTSALQGPNGLYYLIIADSRRPQDDARPIFHAADLRIRTAGA